MREPAKLECPTCDGVGCKACNDRGDVWLTACPLEVVPRDVWQAIEMAELFWHGLAPMPGGVLDQTQVFIDAARFIRGEQARNRAELGIMSNGGC